jgi:hypothetical protein
MSPRKKNVLIVKGWANPKKGMLYKGIVREAKNKTKYVHVAIENLDPTQLGRIHEIDLPLPLRPSRYHRTCSFLIACGIDASIDGMKINLDNIIDTTIGMRFGTVAQNGSQKIEFERIEDTSRIQTNTPGSESVHE